MLLAILADSHDNEASTRAALKLLRPHQPAAYLHAGDLVSPSMLALFAGLPFHFVFGNNEYDHAELRSQALVLGLRCHDHQADLTFANKRVALMHGHQFADLDRLVASGDFHYIIHGHTHLRRDERIGKTRIINPGAIHRAKVRSVALLNVATDTLQFLDLPTPH